MGSHPLAALLRNQVAADDELRRLQDELKAHVFRGVAWFDDERRRIATGRLHRLLPTLPRQLSPAAYTRATFDAEFGVPPYYPHAHDVRAAMLAHHMRGRLCQILIAPFDALRVGEFSAAGFVPGGNGAPAAVPPALWSAAEVVFDLGVGALLVSNVVVFAGVEVSAPPRGASRAALDMFVRRFADALPLDRRFTLGELIEATRAALGNVSGREVESALRLASPAAWAGSGRRPAHVLPTAAELAQAARQAVESRS